jgi:hypothetical protein
MEKFYQGKPCKHCGSTKKYRSARTCVECPGKKVRQRLWIDLHPGYHAAWRKKNPEKVKRYYATFSVKPKHRLRALLQASTVDRSALDFDAMWARLERNGFKCEVTRIPFEWAPRSPCGLSIDKINRALPYTMDNVRLVCWWVNAAMGTWGLDELKRLIKMWRKSGRI